MSPASPTSIRPGELDPRTLARLRADTPAHTWVRATFDATRADPDHATSTLRHASRGARKLRSRERRALFDVVYDCIRLDALARHLELHPLDLWLEDRDLNAYPFHLRAGCPEAVAEDLLQTYGDEREDWLRASNQRASAHLRVNTSRASRDVVQQRLADDGIVTTPIGTAGLRVEERANLLGHRAYRDGLFEIQDLASQRVAALGEGRVLDYCAGAGGKALAMAAAGLQVSAWDVRRNALDELQRRAKRAKTPIQILSSPPAGQWDTVLVDAPCSGSGVWRRHPEFRWRLREGVQSYVQLQTEILEAAAACVRPGGRLIYATCSVLTAENEAHGGQTILRSAPHKDPTDGMFAATL